MKGFVLMVAAGVAAVVAALVGVVPIHVRDQGEDIACGSAVLGNGTRLAELTCADVSAPFKTLTILLLVVAVMLIGYGALALRHSADRLPTTS